MRWCAGKEVAERGKAQDLLYLLAAYSKSQFPLDLYVTDGVAFDLLQMRETSLFIYQDIPARTALHHMSKLLCQVGTNAALAHADKAAS